MKTGIVCKVEGRKAVILKTDGSFVSLPAKKTWKPGDIVPIPGVSRKPIAILGACAACIAFAFLGGFGWKQLYASPVALISIDVNPSIELSINRFNQVILATALNDEGAQILDAAGNKHIAYQEALANILSAEELSGYLEADADLVLTVFSSDPQRQSALLSELEEIVDSNIARYSDNIAAEYHAVDEHTVDGAHGCGVTAGKYLYLQRLREVAPETDIAEYQHHSIEQIKGEIESCEHEEEKEEEHKRDSHKETHHE